MTARAPYDRSDRAWVHHVGCAGHVESTRRGVDAGCGPAFGDETLPEGPVVIAGVKRGA